MLPRSAAFSQRPYLGDRTSHRRLSTPPLRPAQNQSPFPRRRRVAPAGDDRHFVPAFFLGQQVAREAAKGVEQIRANLTPKNWEKFQKQHPRVGRIADRIEREVNLRETLQKTAGAASGTALSAEKGSVQGVVQLFIVFFFLFFFFKDSDRALAGLRSLLPLTDDESQKLFDIVDDTIHAVLSGMLLVALAQGTLGGLIFWWLGLPRLSSGAR